MRCEDCWEAISARLDGEDEPEEAAVADAHLADCPACRAYADRAARVTRLARTTIAEPGPSLVDAVLAAPRPLRRRSVATAVRMAIGAVAVGQCALAVSGILSTAAHSHHGGIELAGASTAHFAHESSAWNMALAVGFLLAATQASRTSALVPVISAFVVVLAALSVLDLLAGRVDIQRLLGHGLVVIGLALLIVLRRAAGGGHGGAEAIPATSWTVAARGRQPRERRPGEIPGSAPGDGLQPTARRGAA